MVTFGQSSHTTIEMDKNESESEPEFDSDHSESEKESVDSRLENNPETESDNSNMEQKEQEDEHNSVSNDIGKMKMNPGWADAMRKVLNNKKPKRKKSIVLSKAKKHCTELEVKKETLSFDIDANDDSKSKIPVVKENEEKVSEGKRNKNIKTGIRRKPTILDKERERVLQKIATKGVLQLFNAVKHQQVDIDKKLVEAGPLERKREKVLKDIDKKAFLDVLMGGTKSVNVDSCANESTVKKETSTEKKEVWKVLRDDFVMGASLKDWDKKTPVDERIDSDE